VQSLLFSLIDVTLYSHFIQKTYLCGKYSAIGCVRVTVLSFFLTYLKLETGFGYPVPKMGNVANRYSILLGYKRLGVNATILNHDFG